MSETEWHAVDEDVSVSFTFGCECRASHRGRVLELRCASAGYAHGHAAISSDDGVCTLPFPVASQDGLRRLLDRCAGWISQAERFAILGLPSARALPDVLTDGEAAILGDPERFAAFDRYAFVGF